MWSTSKGSDPREEGCCFRVIQQDLDRRKRCGFVVMSKSWLAVTTIIGYIAGLYFVVFVFDEAGCDYDLEMITSQLQGKLWLYDEVHYLKFYNDLESDDGSVDTPLVSPFLDSDDESDDVEVLNKLDEYGNEGNFYRKMIINSFDGEDLAFPFMIGFRKFVPLLANEHYYA
ncbi:hypothetical protein Tco_0702930 [Tanacetum coccineum]|uniref:Transmembrane protein n=1 Tax=Tanacetum coccineum TaxID=301880 RepID=A0ABQ4XXD8_9ASTR